MHETVWGNVLLLKKKTFWLLFMDGVQLPQGYSHFEEAVYLLPLSSQKFLALILSTSEGGKAESTLEPPSGFEYKTPGLGIQRGIFYCMTITVCNRKIDFQNWLSPLPPDPHTSGTGWGRNYENYSWIQKHSSVLMAVLKML